jgi:hypothetical protein
MYSTGNLTVADFNGDGRSDFVCTYNPTQFAFPTDVPTAYILIAKPTGGYTSTKIFGNVFSMMVADFDGDGRTDLLRPGVDLSSQWTNGKFAKKNAISWNCGLGQQGAADFNGDGVSDLYCFDDFFLTTSITRADGKFGPKRRVYVDKEKMGYGRVAIGDYNGDGRADVLVASGDAPTLKRLYFSKGDGTFSKAKTVNLPVECNDIFDRTLTNPLGLDAGDVNGDGKSDIVCRSRAGAITTFLSRGDGTFETKKASERCVLRSWEPQLADMNGDGAADIFCRSEEGRMTALLSQRDGTFVRSAGLGTCAVDDSVRLGTINTNGIPVLICITEMNRDEEVE